MDSAVTPEQQLHTVQLRDHLLRMLNHELRTPLTALIEGLELIREGADGETPEERRALVEVLSSNARRMARITEELREISLLTSVGRVLDPRPGNLRAVLEEVCKPAMAAANRKTIRFSCEALPPVVMDAQAIREILTCLVHHGLRRTGRDGEVVVRAAPDDRGVAMTVSDHGAVVASEELHQFLRQLHAEPGLGLPTACAEGWAELALCHQLLEAHHGTLDIQASLPQGLTVTATLPIASAVA